MGLVGGVGLVGLGGGRKTLANFESLPKCVSHRGNFEL